MKVLQLRFKNINSLKGEHLIDFREAPLSETGIFAIVGPTGAGKSTILDVITLGLYGRVPRIDKIVTKAQVEGKGSIVTHHESEAWVEVTFQSKSIDYISRWAIRKTNRGTWADHSMQVSRAVDGIILVEKKSEAAKFNEQLIGLNYEQFIKSILLSQGDFARFLKSKHHDRGQLLEEITGTHIYREIGREAYQKYGEVSTEIKLAKERIADVELLPEEKLLELKQEINALSKSVKNYKTELETLDGYIKQKENLKSLSAQLDFNEKAILRLKADKNTLEKDLKRLEQHKKIAHLGPDLYAFKEGQAHKLSIDRKMDAERKGFEKAKEAHIEALKDLSKLTKLEITDANFAKEMSIIEDKILSKDLQLLTLKKRGEEIRSTLQMTASKEAYPLQLVLLSGGDPKDLENQVLQQLGSLPKPSLPQEELVEHFQLLSRQKVSLQHLIDKIEEGEQLIQDQNTSTLHLKQLTEGITKINEDKKELEIHSKILEKKVAELQIAKVKQAEITSLDDKRSKLVSGEPCPLCGAIDHPYANHHDLLHYVKIDTELEGAKTEVLRVQNQLLSKNKELTTTENNAKHLAEKIKGIGQNLKVVNEKKRENLASIRAFTEIVEQVTSIQAQKLLNDVENKTEALKGELEAFGERKYLEACRVHLNDLQDVLALYKTLNKERKQLYTGTQIKDETNPIQDRYTTAISNIKRHEHLLATLQKDMEEHMKKQEVLLKNLEHAMHRLGYTKLDQLSEDILPEPELRKIAERDLEFHKREASLAAEQSKLKIAMASIHQDDKIKELSIETLMYQSQELNRERDEFINQLGAKDQIVKDYESKASKVKTFLKEIDTMEKQGRKWALLNNIIGDASGNKHANFAQELTLKNLIALANNRLIDLSDRYLLAPPIDNEDMRIVDRYQGNISRSASTLSGGETFIISLALALSLSDMASKNVRLESLFIDEGFGTLDHETLEIALSTLENLQSESKKTIGVISHVDALKERLNTQIRLIKDTSGYSKLEVV